MKTVVLIIVGALFGVLGFKLLQDEPKPTTKLEVVERYVVAPASDKAADSYMAIASPLGTTMTLAAASAPVQQQASELGRKLNETTNVKAFVLDAIKHPEQGGLMYALLALRQCAGLTSSASSDADRTIQNVVASESTISQTRMAAIKSGADRCTNLDDDEIAQLKNQILSLKASDPLFSTMMQYRLAKPADRQRAYDKVMASQNMAMLSELQVPTMFVQKATQSDGKGSLVTRMNGQTYKGEDVRIPDFAAQLSTCGDGDYCALDLYRRGECSYKGNCYDSASEYVKNRFFKDQPDEYSRVIKLSQQMRDALIRNDTSFFQ